MADIIFSTGDIKQNYKVIGVIYAASVKKYGGGGAFIKTDAGYIDNKTYNKMLDDIYVEAIDLLKTKAELLGADAVTFVKMDIEQLTMSEKGLLSEGTSLRMQLFINGTAVSFI